ncbi:hypothetical protein VE03_10776, partial [Pseudogymnoascus sp. 23342-1-I1]
MAAQQSQVHLPPCASIALGSQDVLAPAPTNSGGGNQPELHPEVKTRPVSHSSGVDVPLEFRSLPTRPDHHGEIPTATDIRQTYDPQHIEIGVVVVSNDRKKHVVPVPQG